MTIIFHRLIGIGYQWIENMWIAAEVWVHSKREAKMCLKLGYPVSSFVRNWLSMNWEYGNCCWTFGAYIFIKGKNVLEFGYPVSSFGRNWLSMDWEYDVVVVKLWVHKFIKEKKMSYGSAILCHRLIEIIYQWIENMEIAVKLWMHILIRGKKCVRVRLSCVIVW